MSLRSSSRGQIQAMILNFLFVFLSLTESTRADGVPSVLSGPNRTPEDISSRATVITEKKVTTGIPNTNLKVSLNGLRESGSFYTSKDLTSTFAFTSQDFEFGDSNGSGNVDLQLNSSTTYQEMDFGTAMTDSSAWNLLQLKQGNESMYNQTMDYLFNVRSGSRMIRVPMGSSDFSTNPYTYQDNPKSEFSIDRASDIIAVLQDAKQINPDLKIMLSPWTAPSFWKKPQTLNGGTLEEKHENDYADYFLKAAQAFTSIGLRPFAFTLQNEPTFQSSDYPTMLMSPSQQASLGSKIRSRLDKSSFEDVLLIAHDNNFARLDESVEVVSDDPSVFDGAAFHAYSGTPDALTSFRQRTSNQDNWLTESSTQVRNETTSWDSTFFFLDSLFLPASNSFSRSVILWNTALDQGFGPRLPSAYCDNCVPSLEVTPDSVSFYPQSHILSSFSVASSSLKSFSGSDSRRVSQVFPSSTSKLNSTEKDCLQAQSFVSSYTSDISENQEKRFGVVLVNQCDNEIGLRVGADNQVMKKDYPVQPGLTTLQFSLTTNGGCSPNCGSDGPDPNWKGNLHSSKDGGDNDDNSSKTVHSRFSLISAVVIPVVSIYLSLHFF